MTNKKIALVLVSLLTLFLTACTQKASDPKQETLKVSNTQDFHLLVMSSLPSSLRWESGLVFG